MRRTGQSTVEFAIVYAGVVLPVTFMVVYTAQLLWIWNSVVEFSRDGARYAATHCWQPGGANVVGYMRQNVPLMLDQDQFQNGEVEITVNYFSKDPDSGALVEFTCDGAECSTECVPEVVTVHVLNYEFRRFMSYIGLPPVQMPDFLTTLPVESLGCDPDQGTCLP